MNVMEIKPITFGLSKKQNKLPLDLARENRVEFRKEDLHLVSPIFLNEFSFDFG